ncbi:DNA-binding transcriptional LysR family regulator [Catenuloplanes nepalensis]|uniref:DNA-binding transcriptional LysR family regulator n=1 Tax=Catenuloplanes nepalensis TaxID=587533 RepID=A0ABT9MXS3_9ACTN|nr:LysR family transcriptional regulator [Catenuloplanes nepalensis]MDP9796053.1 DNA-binding transcriptional LysR family regulator [Catenuloplanes nepalensis]
MDLVVASRAFVAVARHGSFTVGAAALHIPQSVASRRVSALEEHLGGALLDRSSRTVTLTPFGAGLLPAAQRLIRLADTLELDAERARRRPFRLTVPAICPPAALARLVAAARTHGLHLELSTVERADGAALIAVPPDVGVWVVPLGLAAVAEPVTHVENLRPAKADPGGTGRRLWIQPEDDVPHVRDRVIRAGAATGLRPAQIVPAGSLVEAAAEALSGDDLLLCSAAQAADLGLRWAPAADLDTARGYDVTAGPRAELTALRTLLHVPVGHCLGIS